MYAIRSYYGGLAAIDIGVLPVLQLHRQLRGQDVGLCILRRQFRQPQPVAIGLAGLALGLERIGKGLQRRRVVRSYNFV